MSDSINWVHEQRCLKTVKSLQKHGFGAVYCENRQRAYENIIGEAQKAQSIGFGGSATIDQLQIKAGLGTMGKELLIHGRPELSPAEKLAIRHRQLTCDLFLCSSNAVTLAGQLVNIDGYGNRVGAMSFGPKKVVVVVGRNKIVEDTEAAMKRIKTYAGPMNAHRLKKTTPCAVTGFCNECKSDERICRITVILDRQPSASDITVLVVNEDLGY